MKKVTHMVDDLGSKYCSTWSRVPGPNTQNPKKVTCPGCLAALKKVSTSSWHHARHGVDFKSGGQVDDAVAGMQGSKRQGVRVMARKTWLTSPGGDKRIRQVGSGTDMVTVVEQGRAGGLEWFRD